MKFGYGFYISNVLHEVYYFQRVECKTFFFIKTVTSKVYATELLQTLIAQLIENEIIRFWSKILQGRILHLYRWLMYSRPKKKRNTPIYFYTNYRTEMKLVEIIMDYSLL